jgi:hypothetical protein
LEFHALGEVLDVVAPYNVAIIPSYKIGGKWRLFGAMAGKSISNKIFSSLDRFIVEDIPQIILQIIYIFSREESVFDDENGTFVVVSLVFNFASLLITFYKFFTIRPSIIT